MSDEDDSSEERKKALWRATSPEFRITELIERLGQRVEADAAESLRRDEENKRNIEFILRQEAQFAADMQQMQAAQARAEGRWGRTEESIRALLTVAEIHEREIAALAEAQAKLAEAQAEVGARTDRQMAETDERLNALVNAVERIISEKRNRG